MDKFNNSLNLPSSFLLLSAVPTGELECEMKSDSSPERDHGHDDDVNKDMEVTDGNKKRKRKPYRPGEKRGRGSPAPLVSLRCFVWQRLAWLSGQQSSGPVDLRPAPSHVPLH